ncbi:MAG: transposase [Cryomorphaceae bacterium]|nr:transposase [Cryomorphaceae bacterium]
MCREHGISQPTFYQWQRKCGGMEVSELKRLKEMEAELSQFSASSPTLLCRTGF